MLSSFKSKAKTLELTAVNAVKEKIKIDKKTIISLFDTYFKRKEAEEIEQIIKLGGFLICETISKFFNFRRQLYSWGIIDRQS